MRITCDECGKVEEIPLKLAQALTDWYVGANNTDFCPVCAVRRDPVALAEYLAKVTEESWVPLFWDKVEIGSPTECWEWTAYTKSTGYGGYNVKGKTQRAHRLAWMLHYGPIPGDQWVCHSCESRSCCNPAHLYLAVPKKRSADTVARGRQVSGAEAAKSVGKLSAADVLAIRAALARNVIVRVLANKYNVNVRTIRKIKRRQTWAWLEESEFERINALARAKGVRC